MSFQSLDADGRFSFTFGETINPDAPDRTCRIDQTGCITNLGLFSIHKNELLIKLLNY